VDKVGIQETIKVCKTTKLITSVQPLLN